MLISDKVAKELKAQFPECLQASGMALSFLTYSAAARELERMQANKSLAYAASVCYYGDAKLWIVAFECFTIPPIEYAGQPTGTYVTRPGLDALYARA